MNKRTYQVQNADNFTSEVLFYIIETLLVISRYPFKKSPCIKCVQDIRGDIIIIHVFVGEGRVGYIGHGGCSLHQYIGGILWAYRLCEGFWKRS